MSDGNPFSLGGLIRRFWRKAALTWVLVVLDAAALVSIPVAIGWAVDGLMNDSWEGVLKLGGICFALLLVGSSRRFYDTRAYGEIYCVVADEVVEAERRKGRSLSTVSARVSLFKEFVDFLEESVPALLNEFIGLFGTLAIIALIDLRVFFVCLGAAVFTVVIYGLSGGRIFRLNRGVNDETEKQVAILESGDRREVARHFQLLTRWRIRMSDLDTLNYSLIWLALSGALIYTVVAVATSGAATMGQVVSAVMYVFGFIEAVLSFPFYYAQLIRLREIAGRLESGEMEGWRDGGTERRREGERLGRC